MTEVPELRRQVIRTVEVAPDLEVHVCVLSVDDTTVIEIRNWIPSSKTYGRGIVLPPGIAGDVTAGIADAVKQARK